MKFDNRLFYHKGGGGGIDKITKFHCFETHFTLISCSSETTKGRGAKVYLSESSSHDHMN